MPEKTRKKLFYIMIALGFLAVTIYEFLTPNMSDDIIYWDKVAEANSFFDLFRQEAEHYITHTGRSVAHIILRIFLYINIKGFFNVVAGAVFMLLSLLIYYNVQGRKTYDIRLYGFILALMWFMDPAIANTVFWEDGACNYLFTTTIIMGFITLYRRGLHSGDVVKKPALFAALMFLYGIIAGWCNENTSGAVVLFILIELIFVWSKNQKTISFLKPWMVTGLVGSMIGLAMMVLAPGNTGRLYVTDEEHTGLLAIVARFLKITLNIKNSYIVLVAAFAVIMVFIYYFCERNELFILSVRLMTLFGVLFLATCYALIMVPTSELRSYYGASIFLMTALAQGIAALCKSKEKLLRALVSSVVIVAGIIFVLGYIDDGANLARIKRESDERDTYLAQMAAEGATDVQAPMIRPLWENRFTIAYEADIQEDSQYWINYFIAQHYGLESIRGVDREEWTAY